jgi:Putative F0F1-ATPase subunit Ca2+/Mg2+ transporter
MTPSALASTLVPAAPESADILMPPYTPPRRVTSPTGLKWPGLTTAQSLAVASQFGLSLAVAVGLGLVGGQWLDGQAHTGLLFTLLGVLAGLILGVSSIVALYRATLRSSEREWRGRSQPNGERAE